MSDFEKTAMAIADKDIIDSKLDVAIIASLPQSYERLTFARTKIWRLLKVTTDKTIGKIKDRVELTSNCIKNFSFSQMELLFYNSSN